MRLQAVAALLVAAAVLLGPERAAAKLVQGELSLSSFITDQYISKFSFSEAQDGHIRGNFTVVDTKRGSYYDKRPHDLRVLLFDDEAWPRYYDAAFTKQGLGSLCIERMRMASFQLYISPTGAQHWGEPFFSMDIPANKKTKRSHFWYAVLSDCYLEEYDAHPPPLHYNITFLNGGSHLPADETGLPTVYFVVLLGTLAFGGFVTNLLRQQYKVVGQVHLIVLLLAGAVVAQTWSHTCELLHLIVYISNGKGLRWRHTFFALDFVAQVSLGMSELLVEFLLITLAFGWTLIDRQGGNATQDPILGRLGLALSTGSAWATRLSFIGTVAAVQVSLAVLGRRFEDDFNQYHDFEHWPGMCLMLLRTALFGLFLVGGLHTLKQSTQDTLRHFVQKLLALGSVWFLAMPALVFSTSSLAPYNRHPVVSGGTIVLQSLALGLVSLLFVQNSSYLKMSTLANMGTIFSANTNAIKRFKVAVD